MKSSYIHYQFPARCHKPNSLCSTTHYLGPTSDNWFRTDTREFTLFTQNDDSITSSLHDYSTHDDALITGPE